MIRKAVLLSIAFFWASNLHAQATANCVDFASSTKNVIYFVNGVGNSEKGMRASRDLLRATVGNTRENRFSIAENRSYGMGKNFYEAWNNTVASVDSEKFWSEVRTQDLSMTDDIIEELYADALYEASAVEYERSGDLR